MIKEITRSRRLFSYNRTSIGTIFSTTKIKNEKSDHHFINFIRFVSMIGIVSIHSLVLPKGTLYNDFLRQIEHPGLYIGFVALLRFSVISFCMISGYLIAPKAAKLNWNRIYFDRCSKMLKPFFFAVLISATIFFIVNIVKGRSITIVDIISKVVFDSPFWFIQMTLVSLFLLLLILKLKEKFQLLLFITLVPFITLKYVYLEQYHHSNIIFWLLFVFYYWLGVMIWRKGLIEKINKINPMLLISIWLLTYLLSNFEIYSLWKINFPHVNNNLRITNQLYAIVSFMALVRLSKFFKFSKLNPRSETFGIYLYHSIVGAIGFGILKIIITYFDIKIGFESSILLTCLHFLFTYTLSTIVVKRLLKLGWFCLNSDAALKTPSSTITIAMGEQQMSRAM